jgi:hypothetical protein
MTAYRKQSYSPWGEIQHQEEIAEGITVVSTASHGGMHVDNELFAAMPAALKCNVYGTGQWFEEDVEVALVMIAFPDAFENRQVRTAVGTIEHYAKGGTYARAARWLAETAEGAALRKRLVETHTFAEVA